MVGPIKQYKVQETTRAHRNMKRISEKECRVKNEAPKVEGGDKKK